MMISTKAWTEYIRKMSAISEKAAAEMQRWIQKNGFGDDQALLEYAFALSSQYGEAIGALACDMYEKIAEAQGVIIPPAEMADTPEFGEVAKAVHGTMKESLNKVEATVGRLVKQTGADTLLKNAKRDGAYFAWIAHGDTCPYCLMLSAIGWQKAGKNTIRGKHADHIHPHCDCQYVVDFKGDLKVEGYDPEKTQREIMDIVDPDEEEYSGFDDFVGRYGRQTWSRKGRDNTGLNIIRSNMRYMKKTGGISGAYTYKNDPNGKKREKVSKAFYEQIRNRKPGYEIAAVAKHSGMSEDEVERIFKHVFIREHRFENGSVKRFDPDYYMQQSWIRLRNGKNIQPHDLILLQHELAEEKIMGDGLEIAYETAHNEVEKTYNYAKALKEYLIDHDA